MHDRHSGNARRDVFERLQPLPTNRVLKISETGNIATRPRQAGDEPTTNRVCHVNKHNRDRAGCSPNCVERSDGLCPNCVGCELSQFCSERPTGMGVAAEKAKLEPNLVAIHPTQFGKLECTPWGGQMG